MKKWRVTTPCLKGYETGDVIVESGNEKGGYIKENASISIVISQELFDAVPQFFEEIVEPVELPTVFGACDDDGESCLYGSPPKKKGDVWLGGCLCMSDLNLFPEDVPIELRLVPADQPVIPWRKWDGAAAFKKEEFRFIAILDDGECVYGVWHEFGNIWRLSGPFGLGFDATSSPIKLYCPLSEIKMPGGENV